MEQIAFFPIVPDTSLLFPADVRGVHTQLSLSMETGKTFKQQTIKQDKIMNYYVITETNWAKLRDEILSLAECCHQAFGEKSKHTDWLHNGDVCRLLNISKRTLQHYRDTGVLPFTQIGHKCYYKREDVEQLLLARTDKPKNNSI